MNSLGYNHKPPPVSHSLIEAKRCPSCPQAHADNSAGSRRGQMISRLIEDGIKPRCPQHDERLVVEKQTGDSGRAVWDYRVQSTVVTFAAKWKHAQFVCFESVP